MNDVDEIWFIIDTDQWGKEVDELRENVTKHNNWFVAQSNPCFEVWLYFHFKNEKPKEIVRNWKEFLNETVKGGFNNNKHPVYIQTAIINSETNFSTYKKQPDKIATEVFILAKNILPIVKSDIDAILESDF